MIESRMDQCLQGKQRKVYDQVELHSRNNDLAPLRIIVLGTAGTGKSFLIKKLKHLLIEKIAIVAPTGVAAFNVNGSTIHNLLKIFPNKEFEPLKGESLLALQEKFKEIKYLVLEEISMIGRRMLGKIDARLRQAFPSSSSEVFGGCSILAFGDYGQLPPVLDLPLYSSEVKSNAWSTAGQMAYQSFSKAVILKQVITFH